MPNRAAVAAHYHRMQCEDPRFGYTQGPGRWGSGPIEDWTYEGVHGKFMVGDRDCSSSVIDCWQEALRGSPYEGALSGATYTGNMRSVFVGSGLFEWKPMSFIAQTGDIYLNEKDHTAMCQSAEPDVLSEFVLNERGGITGGQIGDQTGWESRVRGYYDFPWNGILHYNGKADDDMEAHDVWEYNYNGTAPDGNMYNCAVATNKAVRSGGICSWSYRNPSEKIDAYQALMETHRETAGLKKSIEELTVGGIEAAIDYEKLADALAPKLADIFAARMRE